MKLQNEKKRLVTLLYVILFACVHNVNLKHKILHKNYPKIKTSFIFIIQLKKNPHNGPISEKLLKKFHQHNNPSNKRFDIKSPKLSAIPSRHFFL